MSDSPLIRHLGLAPYEPTWRAMQKFTDERQDATRDEVWFVEHPPVFTLGLNASREHLLAPGDIPVVQIDRGGQVTYHGPGQLMIYPLLNLRRRKLGVRDLVVALENAVIDYAAELGISASGSRQAPGVYVEGAKLASVGLRIRRGACAMRRLARATVPSTPTCRRLIRGRSYRAARGSWRARYRSMPGNCRPHWCASSRANPRSARRGARRWLA